MESKFHRWWLGSCVAALLLASWAGGFSVAVTAVFVVIYLTGATLVGPEDEADIGLAPVEERPEPRPHTASAAEAQPVLDAKPEAQDEAKVATRDATESEAEPYPDDDADAEPALQTPLEGEPVVVETDDAVDAAAVVVETPDPVDTAALVVHTDAVVDTTAVVDNAADVPEPSSAGSLPNGD